MIRDVPSNRLTNGMSHSVGGTAPLLLAAGGNKFIGPLVPEYQTLTPPVLLKTFMAM